MKSNFEFLNDAQDLRVLYGTAKSAEELYTEGNFNDEFESIRKITEYVALKILDLNYVDVPPQTTLDACLTTIKQEKMAENRVLDIFYELNKFENPTKHTYSKNESLKGLEDLHELLVWFAKSYDMIKDLPVPFVEPVRKDYSTSERKIIYVQTADNSDGMWPAYDGAEKIGDASIDGFEIDARPNSHDLQEVARRRIQQYMGTAGVPFKVQWAELAYRQSDNTWFRDYDVHEVLRRSGINKKELGQGQEWYETDVETAKKAIAAVKNGQSAIDTPINTQNVPKKIVLRPEQQEAVRKTQKAFKHGNKMLWNAKMRFGKTMSSLNLVKEERYRHVLIMTHRPVVDEGWFDDFKKIGMPEAGYLYGSKRSGEDFNFLLHSNKPFVYFASLQDLRGSELIGGKAGDKNRDLFNTHWDLVIIDEAHEGTQTELAEAVTKQVVGPDTKLLELSGTPFNILDQYDENTTYTWDYVMEQRAKQNWYTEKPEQPNPYEGLPRLSMYTFEMSKQFKDAIFMGEGNRSFNFKEFFRTNDTGKFVYEDKVKQFLRNITTPNSESNYPFSTKEFRNQLRHTLWILPGVKEANALEDLMKSDPIFGIDYDIINVVRDGDDNGVASESDVDRVKEAIGDNPSETRTITLTVRKLTTGVTIKPWTGVVFLSNTNSPTQYLQAAFRAQTPYSDKNGQKTNCYVFDFAPDRALTVMAASNRLNTGVGKKNSHDQKLAMSNLLNFLPIIGEEGQSMKPYSVDSLMAKIKRVYAEKAVRNGFDDDSLYSDELLMLDNVDLEAFNALKQIVGTTKAEKKPMGIDVNNQGLTDEEYDEANKGGKKPKKERSQEEQAAIEKMKKLKKQRRTMISILRSISIRIPLMIYGMDVDFDEDISISKFVQQVDDTSWEEFMPEGVTKSVFRQFSKYYDADVFIEAGKIIRQQVKELDQEDPLERTRNLAKIFATFRNPDKETVLTPWRVVNMQLGMTIGGYNFYDKNYKYTTEDGVPAEHWIKTDYTDSAFSPESRILEINAKTGLYPLYAAIALYAPAYNKMKQEGARKISLEDKWMLWQKILRENVFVVAKTPMAKKIAQRTLVGYRDIYTNIEYVENIVADAQEDVDDEATKIKRLFGNMKFDVVIGNPPYQDQSHGDQDNYKPPIYNEFMDLSYQLSDLVTLITPARFLFRAGRTPKQ